MYVKPEGDTKKTIVKCLAMNDKLVVDAVKDGGREPVHTEIKSVLFLNILFVVLIFIKDTMS